MSGVHCIPQNPAGFVEGSEDVLQCVLRLFTSSLSSVHDPLDSLFVSYSGVGIPSCDAVCQSVCSPQNSNRRPQEALQRSGVCHPDVILHDVDSLSLC